VKDQFIAGPEAGPEVVLPREPRRVHLRPHRIPVLLRKQRPGRRRV
jgi:hypothetical protein